MRVQPWQTAGPAAGRDDTGKALRSGMRAQINSASAGTVDGRCTSKGGTADLPHTSSAPHARRKRTRRHAARRGPWPQPR